MFDQGGQPQTLGERLAGIAPGPELIAALLAAEPAGHADRLALVECWPAVAAWVEAQALAAVAEADRAAPAPADPRDAADDWIREELAVALHVAPVTAGIRLAVARELHSRCRATAAALAGGALPGWAATLIARACQPLPDGAAAQVERALLPLATAGIGLTRLAAAADRAAATADPAGFAARHHQATTDRAVSLHTREGDVAQPDAMATLVLRLTALQAIGCYNTLVDDVHACPDPTDGRSREEKLADAAVARLTGTTPGDGPPVDLVVTVDLPTLIGLRDNPGDCAGLPIPADVVRDLAQDASWRRLVADDVTGRCLDYGRRRYTPPAPLIRHLRALYPTCVFPGCGRQARHCDADHNKPWRAGGTTATANLAPLCRRHHRLKTHGQWKLHHDPATDAITWTTPTGKHAVELPHKYVDPTDGWPTQPPHPGPQPEPEPPPDD